MRLSVRIYGVSLTINPIKKKELPCNDLRNQRTKSECSGGLCDYGLENVQIPGK